jgi:hypothetical protein
MRSILLWAVLSASLYASELTFPESTKEVNVAVDATVLDVDFPFTNKTDKPVVISKVQASCSCMNVGVKGGKQRYEPGEAGVIRATFDMKNQTGEVERLTHVWLQGDPEEKPSIKLTVNFHIPELVKPDPRTLRWEVGESPSPKTIRLTMSGGQPIRVTNVIAPPNNFKHELKTITEGKEYELIVTPGGTTSPAIGVYRVETDCKVESQRLKQVFAAIMKPAKNAPPKP